MVKFVIATLLISTMASMSFAASGASASGSSAKEVEMEMSAEQIRRAKPDAAVYLFSQGKVVSPALLQAMAIVKKEKELQLGQEVKMSGRELALEIINRK